MFRLCRRTSEVRELLESFERLAFVNRSKFTKATSHAQVSESETHDMGMQRPHGVHSEVPPEGVVSGNPAGVGNGIPQYGGAVGG
jgi:hypothetical protein